MAKKRPALHIDDIKDQKVCRALLKNFSSNPEWRIDLDAFRREVVNAHASRPVRSLNLRSTRSADNVINANQQDQATRSRLAEIMLTCRKVHNEITRQLDAVRELMLLKFRQELADQGIRSKEDRANYINYGVFRRIISKLKEIEQLEDDIGIVIADIDQGSYSLGRLVNILEITMGHKSKERTL